MKGCIGKKVISSILSLALCVTAVPMASLTSLAASSTLTTENPSDKQNVKGTGQFMLPSGGGSYSVTIAWGSLAYNYTAKWDATKQGWIQNGSTPFWQVADEDGDRIKVRSGSYNPIDVSFSFDAYGDYKAKDASDTDDVTGTFVTRPSDGVEEELVDGKFSLTRTDKEDKVTYLKLSGAPEGKAIQSELTNQIFGVVTATLKDPNAEQQNP